MPSQVRIMTLGKGVHC